MFHTFATSEPLPETHVPVGPFTIVYDYLTFDTHVKQLILEKNNKVLRETVKLRAKKMSKEGVHVPRDCKTLKEAVELVKNGYKIGKDNSDKGEKFQFSKIVLGMGEHIIDDDYLAIHSKMSIVGEQNVSKEDIVIVGGIFIRISFGEERNVRLQHLTIRPLDNVRVLRQANNTHGVIGKSSFTMEDVIVELCGGIGVFAWGAKAECTNVKVRNCGDSGVVAHNGGDITLKGEKTKVHDNCKKGGTDSYGLKVGGTTSSVIQLVPPLTKESVSTSNSGGGNWGARGFATIEQIKST